MRTDDFMDSPRPRPIELFRSKTQQHLSIVDLITFVTACGVFFGGIRIAGFYGAVFGAFALQASGGRMLRRTDWQFAALACAMTMAFSLVATWWFYGALRRLQTGVLNDQPVSITSFLFRDPGLGPFTLSLWLCLGAACLIAWSLPQTSGQTRIDLIAMAVLSIGMTVAMTFITVGCIVLTR